jgi:hypothetical protein
MPSAIDQRRLRDGANALDVSARAAETLDEVREQLEIVRTGIAALQSLDDLGPQANARACHDEQTLWKRLKVLETRLKDLQGKAAKT